jgi:tetratricopeptide (TPR) repeat protein
MRLPIALSVVVQVALAAAVAGPAAAQSKKDQAEIRYEQGKAYYRTGAYDLAIQEFLEGYKLDPRPGVLFNIARGYEELKDRAKAIEFYKKYLDLGAQATAAVEARARVAGLERAIKEEDEKKQAEAAERERQRQLALNPPPPPVATVPGTTAATATPPAALPATASAGAGPEASVSTTAAPPESPELAGQLKLAGIITGGAGVLLAGAGGFFVWRGSSLKDEIQSEIDRTMTWTDALNGKDADMKSSNTYALIGFIAGGAAIAGGAVLYYLGWSKTPHEGGSTAMLSPVFGPGGTSGLAVTGRF